MSVCLLDIPRGFHYDKISAWHKGSRPCAFSQERFHVLRRNQKLRHCQRRGCSRDAFRLRLHQSLQKLLSAPNLGLLLRQTLYRRNGTRAARAGLYQRTDAARRRAVRAGESARAAPLFAARARRAAAKDHLGLHRLHLGAAPHRRLPSPL